MDFDSFDTSRFEKQFGIIVVGALVLVASLLWRDWLVQLQNEYLPQAKDNLWDSLLILLCITGVLVITMVAMRSLFGLEDTV